MALNKLNEILDQNKEVYIIASGNKNKLEEYKRLLAGKTCINITELSEMTNIAKGELESTENEQDYTEIAQGKVQKVQEAINKHLCDKLSDEQLAKICILGDDYGAACEALKFTYDPNLKSSEFALDYDDKNNIVAIRTSRDALNNKPAPSYFSHRIIEAHGKRMGLDPNDKNFKSNAFAKLAEQLITTAHNINNFNSTATVAIAYARALNTPKVVLMTENYPLIKSPDLITQEGFDFDRIQQMPDGTIIANLSREDKDQNFVRGHAVRKALQLLIAPKIGNLGVFEGTNITSPQSYIEPRLY